jgi:hypothetical protein
MMRSCAVVASALFAALMAVSTPVAAATSCGGSGGTRTQTFTCGPGEFMTALTAYGGSYVNQIVVQCSRIVGELADAYPVQGKESARIGGKPASGNSGFARCPAGTAAWHIDSMCGLYADRLVSITCGQLEGSGSSRVVTRAANLSYLNVGGSGGRRVSLSCPAGQGIYKLTVRSGDWIDRIQIACREP